MFKQSFQIIRYFSFTLVFIFNFLPIIALSKDFNKFSKVTFYIKNITSQLNNYFDIQKILNFENIYFTEINIVKWNSQVRCKYPSRCKFIIKTSNPYLLWYKYDTEAPGGGNNIIYYKDKKIKTTKFITFTENEFYVVLNE